MKEYVKVWQDDEGKVQIEIDDNAPWWDVASRMWELFSREKDERVLNTHVAVTVWILGSDPSGDLERLYIANLQRESAFVRDWANNRSKKGEEGALKVKKPKKAS